MGKTFSRCSRKSVRDSHRQSGRFFLRTGDHFGRTGWILVYRPKEGAPSGSMQWRFLFWHRQKRRKRYFCKSNKTPPLVSARNHKKMLWFWGGGEWSENSDSARFRPFRRSVGEDDNSWRSPFLKRVPFIGLDFNGLYYVPWFNVIMDYIEYQKAPKGGKYTVPPFGFFVVFLHVHKTGKNGQVIYPIFSKSWAYNKSTFPSKMGNI